MIGSVPATLVSHFLETFSARAGLTLHMAGSGRDDHHLAEAAFKALARALRQAYAIDPALADRVASLSGKLDVDSPPGAGTRVRAEIPLE